MVLQVCVLCFALESTHRIVGSQLSAVGTGLEASQASSTPGSWMLCAFSGLRDGVRELGGGTSLEAVSQQCPLLWLSAQTRFGQEACPYSSNFVF